jgi:hypothetical protein
MISRLGGAGVPIVSQSKLRPIFRLLMESGARRKQSPMMKVITATAALLIATDAEPLPVPKPTGPGGGSCPHGYIAARTVSPARAHRMP